jgi:hypothetical protein
MMSRDRKRILAEIILGVGLFFQHIAPCAMVVVAYGRDPAGKWAAAGSTWVAASVITVVGSCMMMQGKGWHPAWGLFGLTGLFGVVVLACLKEREGVGAFEVLPVHKPKPEEFD